jgi:hypothetical protein
MQIYMRFNLYIAFKYEKYMTCEPLQGKLNKPVRHMTEAVRYLLRSVLSVLWYMYIEWSDLSFRIAEK